jgi:L-histidine Nalpha-methyltransferase
VRSAGAVSAVAPDTAARDAFARDVRDGLAQAPKQLPSRYFYDALGSRLFEAICRLPWYGITRAEEGLLARHAPAILLALGGAPALADLGCGSGEKVAILAAAARRARPLSVHLIDVSTAALARAAGELRTLGRVEVIAHCTTYADGVARAAAARPAAGPMLALLLGSNIGNFHPPEAAALLRAARAALDPGDGLLLGADLVKSPAALELAYDDPLGITAAFNRNVLVRMNRELGAGFALAAFAHRARWNAGASRIEMHLVSRRAQAVRVTGAGPTVTFARGETIWTESSYKYEPEEIRALGAAAGFGCRAMWVDSDARFALALLGDP